MSPWGRGTHPDPGLCEVGPHGDLLPRAHVRVAIPLESGLQLLQLLAGEVGPLSPLPLLLRWVVRRVVVLVLGLFFLCKGGRRLGLEKGQRELWRGIKALRRRGGGGGGGGKGGGKGGGGRNSWIGATLGEWMKRPRLEV